MQYCEPHYDMYLQNVVKCDILEDLEQLTAQPASEERKSSVASGSRFGSDWLLDFQQDNHCFPFLHSQPAQTSSPPRPESNSDEPVQDKLNRNQTKNIPKNYGKAILGYIQKNKSRCNKLLDRLGVDSEQFYDFLQSQSRNINSIADLRWLWTDNEFSGAVRMLSYEFMRKHSLPYIFRSRIKNYLTHIKYREKFMEGLRKPDSFRNIKDY